MARRYLASIRPAFDVVLRTAFEIAQPVIEQRAQQMGVEFQNWPLEQTLQVIDETLEEYPVQRHAFHLMLKQKMGLVNEHAKLRSFVLPALEHLLGDTDECTMEGLEVSTEAATAYVRCGMGQGEVAHAKLSWILEWGDWVISDIAIQSQG